MKSIAIVFDRGSVRTMDHDLRDPGDGEVLVQTEITCISPGTELRCLSGLESGTPAEPYIPGYSLVGTVIGSRCSELPEGARVHTGGTQASGDLKRQWGGHCAHAIVKGSDCVPVPESVGAEEASLASLGGIAAHGVRHAEPRAGEQCLVVGLGVLGQLAARLFLEQGASVLACDLAENRVAMARQGGIDALAVQGELEACLRPRLPDGASLVADVTGAAAVLKAALPLVADRPWDNADHPPSRYVIQGSYPGDVAIPYGTAFMKQCTFLVPRDRQRKDVECFLDAVASKRISVSELIHDVLDPAEAPRAYEALRDPQTTAGTIAFRWT